MRPAKILFATAAAAALALTMPGSAAAQPTAGPGKLVLTSAVVLPFNVAIDKRRILVADGGTRTVSRIRADGSLARIATGGDTGDVAGVAISRSGRSIAYTSTEAPARFVNADGTLHIRHSGGGTLDIDLEKYEKRRNPDKARTYGAVGTVSDCAKTAIEAATGQPITYRGGVDAHPYSVAAYSKRSWLVADAGANDIVKVNRFGKVSTVAVLPAQPLTFTAAMAEALGLPACVAGVTYRFESVPTDVEVGASGALYVTTLAGGPESPVLGARSSVYKINPKNGKVTRVATGFAGATNLAVHKGKIYVAELFGNRISVVKNGKPKAYLDLAGVASVESGRGHLYAGTLAAENEGPGAVYRLTKNAATGISKS